MKLPFFSYEPVNSIGVLEKTKIFIEESNSIDQINLVGEAFTCLPDLIPQDEKAIFSEGSLPLVESWHELQVSFNLCVFGFYKQAMTSLRSALELGVLSIYWNINDDGHKMMKNWVRSKEKTPRSEPIWKIILSDPTFINFNSQFKLKENYDKFTYLSNYVHSKGLGFSNAFGNNRSNSQTFEKDLFNFWQESFFEVIKFIIRLHLIKYPLSVIRFNWSDKFGIENPRIGIIDPSEQRAIFELIEKEFIDAVSELADHDIKTQNTFQSIKLLPNINRNEIENQIIEKDKILIEINGFNKWKSSRENALESSTFEEKQLAERRETYLSSWAKKDTN